MTRSRWYRLRWQLWEDPTTDHYGPPIRLHPKEMNRKVDYFNRHYTRAKHFIETVVRRGIERKETTDG